MKSNRCYMTKKHKERRLVKQRFSSFHIINQVKNATNKYYRRLSVATKGIGMLVWSTGVHYGMFKKTKHRKPIMNNISKPVNKNVTRVSYIKNKVVMMKKILELSKQLKNQRKRKARTEVLEMNTVLLWKLACNYGEYKTQSVQRPMVKYCSKNKLNLFSFEEKTIDTLSLQLFKYSLSSKECISSRHVISKSFMLNKAKSDLTNLLELNEYEPAILPTMLKTWQQFYRTKMYKASCNYNIISQNNNIIYNILKIFKLNGEKYNLNKLLELCNYKDFNQIKNDKYSQIDVPCGNDGTRIAYKNGIYLKDCKTLDCITINGNFGVKLSNRDSTLGAIMCNTQVKAISNNSVLKLKSKAFTLSRRYGVPKKNDIYREFSISNINSLEELPGKSDRCEGKYVSKMKFERKCCMEEECGIKGNRRALNSLENTTVLERAESTLSDKCRDTKDHNINNCSVNEEAIKVVPVVKYYKRESDKTADSKQANPLLILPTDVCNNERIDSTSCSTDAQTQDNRIFRVMKNITFKVNRLNEKFCNNSQRNRKDIQKIYTFIYSLQNKFTTGLTAVIGKIDSLTEQENKTKIIFEKRIRKNSASLKQTEKNFGCLKYAVESNIFLNRANDIKNLRKATVVIKKRRTSKKLNFHQLYKRTNKTFIDFKLQNTLLRINKISNTLYRDKFRVSQLVNKNKTIIEDVVKDHNKTKVTTDSKIQVQSKNISKLTERINNVQLHLIKTVENIHENFSVVEGRLNRLENEVTNSKVERKHIHLELDIVKINVNNNQEELMDTAKQMTTLRDFISSCKSLIGDMFGEISIIKRKVDLEIRTQKDINRNVDCNLEAFRTNIKKSAAANSKIGEEEVKDFANTMKRNTLISTTSCNNLRNLSNQMDTAVSNVQDKLEEILTKLNIPNPNLNSAHDITNVQHSNINLESAVNSSIWPKHGHTTTFPFR